MIHKIIHAVKKALKALKSKIKNFFFNCKKVILHSNRITRINLYVAKRRLKLNIKRFIEKLRIYFAAKALWLYKIFSIVKASFFKVLNRLSLALITILGVALSAFIALHLYQLENIQPASEIFYTTAGLIGTVLALTFSLSAIPIQKATESFGSTIAHIYSKDRTFKQIFLLLSVFCLTCLFLGSVSEQLSAQLYIISVALDVLFLAASLDLIRLYNRHSIRLLAPLEAIKRLSKMAQKSFEKHHKSIMRQAKIQRLLIPDSKLNEIQESDVKILLYQSNKDHKVLEHFVYELFEMASRSITTKHNASVALACNEMANLAGKYLLTYKELFLLRPATFGVQTSDANDTLTPVLERLKDLMTLAVSQKDELSYTYALRAMGSILHSSLQVEETLFLSNRFTTANIHWHCLGYYESAVTSAIENNFYDAGLEGVRTLQKVSENVPAEIHHKEFFRHVILSQGKFMLAFLPTKMHVLTSEPVGAMMLVLKQALRMELRDRHDLWKEVLRQLATVFPLAVAIAAKQNKLQLDTPLSAAYSGTTNTSLIQLLADELNVCEVDKERPYVSPYYYFLECAEDLHEHLRDIARYYNLGDNPILYELVQMIGQFSKIFLWALENPLRAGRIDEQDLVRKLEYLLYFLSNAFYDKENVDHNYATDAVQILSYTGLRAYKAGILGLPETCQKIICNITKSWARVGMQDNRYGSLTDDFFEALYYFEKAAELKSDTATADAVRALMEELLATFTPAQRIIIQERLDTGKEQIENDINDLNFSSYDLFCCISILQKIKEEVENPDPPEE